MSWKEGAKRRAKEKAKGTKFKLVEGDNSFRILPNKEGKTEPPYTEGNMHYGVGPEKRSIACGKDINGEGHCWLCDVQIPKLHKKGRTKMANELAAKEAFVVQISEIDESGGFSKAKPWWISARRTIVAILQLLSSAKRSYESPLKGYNVTITRTGSGRNDTQYSAPIPDDRPSKVPKAVLSSIKAFSEIFPEYSEKDQKTAYFGRTDDDEDDEESYTADDDADESYEDDDSESDDEDEDDDSESDDEDEDDDSESDDEDEDDEDESDEEDDEDESDEEDDEDESDEEDDEDESDEDESDEDESDEDESDEEDDEEEEDDGLEEEAPARRPTRKKAAKKSPRKKAPARKGTKRTPARKKATKKATPARKRTPARKKTTKKGRRSR